MLYTKGVDHIGITVSDLQKSKDFYVNGCGMTVIHEEESSCGLADGTFSLWLSTSRDHPVKDNKFDRNILGLDHWSFKVTSMEDLKEIEKTLKSMNVEMEDNGITDDDYGGTAIFAKDPDGMKVEFHLRN